MAEKQEEKDTGTRYPKNKPPLQLSFEVKNPSRIRLQWPLANILHGGKPNPKKNKRFFD
jgi:hypothetical protein